MKKKSSIPARLGLAALIVGSDAFALSSPTSNRGKIIAVGRESASIFGNKHTATTTTMCFSKKDDTVVESSSQSTIQEPDFKVQTWNPLRLLVLRLGLTEPAATSPLNYGKYDGEFTCAYCGQVLFDSTAKYDSGSGWPSFWRTATDNSVQYKSELDGRLECRCKRCSSHLGHIFLDGPRPGTVESELLESSPPSDPRAKSLSSNYLPRFCINGAALRYQERNVSAQ
jgi:peptide-methionine (R)-S-oxide reductase